MNGTQPDPRAAPVTEQAITAAADALAVHRWRSMGVASVECECSAVLHGDGSLTQFPADEAFRRHLAVAMLGAAASAILSAAAGRLKAATADEYTAICTQAVLEATAITNARVAELEQLARDILATFTKSSDGYRAHAGQVQIARWREIILKGEGPS